MVIFAIAFAYIGNRIGGAGDPCGRPALKGLGLLSHQNRKIKFYLM
jgi:hypothetical protein